MNNKQVISNTNIYLDILSNIKTIDDAVQFLSNIGDLASSLYEVEGQVNDKMSEYLSNKQKERIIAYCLSNKINIDNPISFQKFLLDLASAIKALPKITLYLGYEPKDRSVSSISDWLMQNLKQKVLLNIEIDKKIIGGAVFVYKGIYKDYSLRAELDKMLTEKKLTLNYLGIGEIGK